MLHKLELVKSDNRGLTLYSRRPIDQRLTAPRPKQEPLETNPHLRWHPLRAEWVAYAAYRQGALASPPEFDPFVPTTDPDNPTELPRGDYEVAVFDSRFPFLSLSSHDPPRAVVETVPATGKCEMVVFTTAEATLPTVPLDHLELLMEVWADRTAELAKDARIKYVLPFENRGEEMGVTTRHPHSQIYAYPFIPPVPARMNLQETVHFRDNRHPLLQELIAVELVKEERLVYRGEHAVAFVPAWARYPYEVWVAPIRTVPDFRHLEPQVRADLARALKTTLLKYDGLWQRPFPYLMAWYQAPTDGEPHPEAHLHAEFFPHCRTRDRLQVPAGTEIAAGMFANDALPEETARELQAVDVTL